MIPILGGQEPNEWSAVAPRSVNAIFEFFNRNIAYVASAVLLARDGKTRERRESWDRRAPKLTSYPSNTPEYLCIPLYTPVYPCIGLYTFVHPCKCYVGWP